MPEIRKGIFLRTIMLLTMNFPLFKFVSAIRFLITERVLESYARYIIEPAILNTAAKKLDENIICAVRSTSLRFLRHIEYMNASTISTMAIPEKILSKAPNDGLRRIN